MPVILLVINTLFYSFCYGNRTLYTVKDEPLCTYSNLYFVRVYSQRHRLSRNPLWLWLTFYILTRHLFLGWVSTLRLFHWPIMFLGVHSTTPKTIVVMFLQVRPLVFVLSVGSTFERNTQCSRPLIQSFMGLLTSEKVSTPTIPCPRLRPLRSDRLRFIMSLERPGSFPDPRTLSLI